MLEMGKSGLMSGEGNRGDACVRTRASSRLYPKGPTAKRKGSQAEALKIFWMGFGP